jgi:hypothetical protein
MISPFQKIDAERLACLRSLTMPPMASVERRRHLSARDATELLNWILNERLRTADPVAGPLRGTSPTYSKRAG